MSKVYNLLEQAEEAHHGEERDEDVRVLAEVVERYAAEGLEVAEIIRVLPAQHVSELARQDEGRAVALDHPEPLPVAKKARKVDVYARDERTGGRARTATEKRTYGTSGRTCRP